MSQKRKPYKPQLNHDKDARIQIAFLRMAGVSAAGIAKETGYHVKTIENEFKRKEHKNLLHRYLKVVSRRVQLPETDWKVVEKYLKERHGF